MGPQAQASRHGQTQVDKIGSTQFCVLPVSRQPVCQPARLPARPACLPPLASVHACPPACMLGCLSVPAGMPASQPARPPACLPACVPACRHACLPSSLPACPPNLLPARPCLVGRLSRLGREGSEGSIPLALYLIHFFSGFVTFFSRFYVRSLEYSYVFSDPNVYFRTSVRSEVRSYPKTFLRVF
jgi:hypothetical protein